MVARIVKRGGRGRRDHDNAETEISSSDWPCGPGSGLNNLLSPTRQPASSGGGVNRGSFRFKREAGCEGKARRGIRCNRLIKSPVACPLRDARLNGHFFVSRAPAFISKFHNRTHRAGRNHTIFSSLYISGFDNLAITPRGNRAKANRVTDLVGVPAIRRFGVIVIFRSSKSLQEKRRPV